MGNERGLPKAHHHIATQLTNSVDLYQWVYSKERRDDPALKNFIPKLKDHILMRLFHGDHATARLFSNEDRAKLVILQDKVYFYNTMAVNYTTYDGRRESETLNPRTHTDIMTLSQGDVHPYEYSRILGIFRARVLHPSLGSDVQEVDMLWVRFYEFDEKYQGGLKAQRFYRIHFTNSTHGDPFGFINPQDVLRAVHLIPGFRYGRTQGLLPVSVSRWESEGDEDWMYYHVNIIVDRDMFMRFRGGGISHGYMRVIESQFEEMKREQDSLEEVPQVVHPLWDSAIGAGEPSTSMSGITTSVGDTPTAGSNSNDHAEEENTEDEHSDIDYEDDYLAVDEDEDDDDGEAIGQGTYGLGEY